MFLNAGEYEGAEDAKADPETLTELQRKHVVGAYDDAVLTKNDVGKVEGARGR